VIIFDLVEFLSNKSNQTKFFLKKPKSVSVRFGSVFYDKNRFGLVFFWFFSVWVQFGLVFLVSGL